MRKLRVGDMFCGAGGTSHGIVNSDFAEVAWAINHDQNAIKAHTLNHPNTKHYEEDIVSMDISKLTEVDLLWASLECTHFSGAKGGQSRDADSRMLARQMYRYIDKTNPSFVVIENVKEFLTWGPLMEVKKPCKIHGTKIVTMADPEHKGRYYNNWVENIKEMGYEYDYVILNSADYGARTSRSRYFGIFAKVGQDITFPEPTHSKTGKNGKAKWLPCKDHINLADEGNSIFGRAFNESLPKNVRKPLVANTQKRIAAGIKKFCLDGDLIYDHNFIMKYYGNGDNNSSLKGPLHTITTKDRHVLVSVEKEQFVAEHFGTNRSVNQPMPTIMAYKDQKYMVTIEKGHFISKGYSAARLNNIHVSDVNDPLHTIPTRNIHSVVTMEKAQFTAENYTAKRDGNERASSLLQPLKTIPTANIHSLVTMEKMAFIQHHFNSGNNPGSNVASINDPLSTIMTVPKESLVTLNKKMNFLIDVKTRFLTANELKLIQGFDPGYQLIGSQQVQKKAIGNSVVPLMAQKLIEELYLQNHQKLN